MASNAKRKTTRAKLDREAGLRDKRARKEARKAARKQEAAMAANGETVEEQEPVGATPAPTAADRGF